MRPLRQRVIALTAAYAVALAGLIASLDLARTAATAAVPGAIICHTDTGDEAPAPGSHQGTHSADNCCVGCPMLTAALPPPPTKAVGAPESASQPLAAPQRIVLGSNFQTKDHRSRAPPLAA
jgi:hypothetical protein